MLLGMPELLHISLCFILNVVRYAIYYHLYNLKNMKNTHGGLLILVKLQADSSMCVFYFFK